MNVKAGNFHKGDEKTFYTAIWGFYLTLLSLFAFWNYLLVMELKYNLL